MVIYLHKDLISIHQPLLTLYHTIRLLTPLEKNTIENIVEKGENAG